MNPDQFEIIQGEIRQAQLKIRLIEQSEQLELYREALKHLVSALEGFQIRDQVFESAYELAKALIDGYLNRNH